MSNDHDRHLVDRQVLESFVIDNHDFERLEALLEQFNIFEAIGVVRQELRHSDFLAFLLNPEQPHGLGDAFLKSFLQKVLLVARGADMPISLIDLDVWSLEETAVQREWGGIDIFLLNDEHKLAVIIENKIDSWEHSNQLGRYHQTVNQRYPEHSVIGLFLTPEGELPSDERFLPVSYGVIAELVESLVSRRESTLGTDIKTLMSHYAQMLRRHIVSESEIADLCRKIYQKHQRALDLIFEHKPDIRDQIVEILKQVILETEGVELDNYKRSFVCFAPIACDVLLKKSEKGWSSAGRVALFWFKPESERIWMAYEIGPGPEAIRRKLFEMANRNSPPFKPGSKTLYPRFSRIWSREFVSLKPDEHPEDLAERIRANWVTFIENEMPTLVGIILKEFDSNGS